MSEPNRSMLTATFLLGAVLAALACITYYELVVVPWSADILANARCGK